MKFRNKEEGNRTFQSIYNSIVSGSVINLKRSLSGKHPADVADIYEDLDGKDREKLLVMAPKSIDASVLKYLNDDCKREVIDYLGIDHFKKSLKKLRAKEIVRIIESLDDENQKALLNIINITHGAVADSFDKYKEDSVGRCMSLDFILVKGSWTVEETMTYIGVKIDLAEDCSEVFVFNDSVKSIGVISMTTLIRAADKHILVKDLANYDLVVLKTSFDQEEACDIFSKYQVSFAPVVDDDDESGRMVGVLRAADVFKIAEEEATEDYLKLAGVSDKDVKGPFLYVCFERFRWLLVSLINAVFSPVIVFFFENSIKEVISLATLMPIVGSIGGNLGMQSVSIVTKAFLSNQLREQRVLKVVFKEVIIGGVNGLILGAILGVLAGLFFKSIVLGIILGFSMVFCSIWASFIGAILPIILDRLGSDPALSSSPLITTITDVSGYFIFLGLATLFLV